MQSNLSSTKFTTTDGLIVLITEFHNHTNYEITDNSKNKFIATIRHYPPTQNIDLFISFIYPSIVTDDFTIYTEEERKTKHLGKLLAVKRFTNLDNAELMLFKTVRTVASLSPQYITALNEIQNLTLQIKSSPDSSRIPDLLNIMQIQLDYLKNNYPQ